MPFLRFTRDKRGYEHFQLVESTMRRGRTRTKVIYWFRTPPGVKVGREPFDEETRRALEAKHPGVVFDWKKITSTPIPSADAEKWRERRREERAAKRARKARDEPEVGGDVADADAAELPEFPAVSDTIGVRAVSDTVGVDDDAPVSDTAGVPDGPDFSDPLDGE